MIERGSRTTAFQEGRENSELAYQLGDRSRAVALRPLDHQQYARDLVCYVASYARLFSRNLFEHLHPDFLILHGDRNLRHSTGRGGHLSWLDGMAVACAPLLLLRRRKKPRSADEGPTISNGVVLLSLAGIFTAIIPRAHVVGRTPCDTSHRRLALSCVADRGRARSGSIALELYASVGRGRGL